MCHPVLLCGAEILCCSMAIIGSLPTSCIQTERQRLWTRHLLLLSVQYAAVPSCRRLSRNLSGDGRVLSLRRLELTMYKQVVS